MNEEDKVTDEALDAGLTIEGMLDKRFDDLFKKKWNSNIRPFVMQMINDKVAEEALKLGRQIGEINGKRGEL
jgi:hypothetical protein